MSSLSQAIDQVLNEHGVDSLTLHFDKRNGRVTATTVRDRLDTQVGWSFVVDTQPTFGLLGQKAIEDAVRRHGENVGRLSQ